MRHEPFVLENEPILLGNEPFELGNKPIVLGNYGAHTWTVECIFEYFI